MSLQVVPNPDIDAVAVLKRMNRNHPRCWGDDYTSAHGCVHRDISAVIGPIRVFDCFSVALPIGLVEGLLSFVVVVMVIAMGLSGGADTDASDSNQKCSNAETLSKRHGRAFN